MLETASQYFTFLQDVDRTGAKSYLPILRDGLFHIFLETSWKDLAAKILPDVRLTVASIIPEVLQLPWELLSLTRDSDVSSIIRLPRAAEGLIASSIGLSPGPLRVLFMAVEPIDYENEEQSIIQIAEGLDMALAISESGTWEELLELAESFRPHLVHLAGQGKVSGDGVAFSMQGTVVRTDLRSAEELAAALRDFGLSGIILSSQQSEPPSVLHLLCQRLAEIIPMAVAWNAPTAAALPLYRALASGLSMDSALLSVCREIAVASDPVSVPALYSIYDLPGVFDSQKRATTSAYRALELPALPGLTEGRTECFVDRRRDLQRLIPALLDGEVQALIITGRSGVGKSSLATYLARLSGDRGLLHYAHL